jgi:penicillin amidase
MAMVITLSLLILSQPAGSPGESGRPAGSILRDTKAYGVPVIKAFSAEDAMFFAGMAVAEDRLWQMEQSRLASRGKMAAIFGKAFANADREVRQYGYTDAELQKQFEKLAPTYQSWFKSYARGVNATIANLRESGKLPAAYMANDFEPAPWTVLDSVAITIKLMQTFGRGGAGELRNWAALEYLKGRPNLKDSALDTFDDLIWQNEKASVPTISDKDDLSRKSPVKLPSFTREDTVRQLGLLPKLGLLDLFPMIRTSQREDSIRVAEAVGAPFKSGSYAIVIGPSRSKTKKPVLLSAPQMGFTNPSIVHEMAIDAPGMKVTGMNVPGIPGVLVGATPNLAWGVTSGVADVEDIYALRKTTDGKAADLDGANPQAITAIPYEVMVKGESSVKGTRQETSYGIVEAEHTKSNTIFARQRAYWMREMESMAAIYGLYTARTATEADLSMQKATMSFNAFYASMNGEYGYRYAGVVPIRAAGFDPRFPLPASPASRWKGMIPQESMPHAMNPSSGLLTNWNNKPASWWPNWDTPVWGRGFRNESLNGFLTNPKLGVSDVERAAWGIARRFDSWTTLGSYFEEASSGTIAEGFDGWALAGSVQASIYQSWEQELRNILVLPTTGNFASQSNFEQITSPHVLSNALENRGKTKFLGTKSKQEIAKVALDSALVKANLVTGFRPGTFLSTVDGGVLYGNRGTYIQIIEMLDKVRGKNVVPPGIATEGPNSADQLNLARTWSYKTMTIAP